MYAVPATWPPTAVPTAATHFAELAHVFRPDTKKPEEILASFRRFYFDTALLASPAALPSLTAFAEEGHILFGTDFPFAPADVTSFFTRQLDAYADLTVDERAAINHGNTEVLFPRLVARPRRL